MVLATIVTALSCRDRPSPVAPVPVKDSDTTGTARLSYVVGVIKCRGTTTPAELTCGNVTDSLMPRAILLGGENTYIRVDAVNPTYDAASETYQVNVTLRNLIEQALGTSDGTNVDPEGIKLFFQNGPVATVGTGTITVLGDGVGTFTATGQPYFQLNAMVAPFATSSARAWQFRMPATVTAFEYTVYVSAPVQYPDGYIVFTPTSYTLKPDSTRTLLPIVKSAAGNVIGGATVTWTSADTTVAVVNAAGVVTGVRSGSVAVTATSGTRSGTAQVGVTGTQRIWHGTTNTDFDTRTNWIGNIVATAQDTIVLPDTALRGIVLPRNVSVRGVDVRAFSIDQAAFDLTASGSVSATGTGSIVSSSGRLILTGTAQTMAGILPRIRVTGSYSLAGNVTTKQIVVIGGRLRNSTFRLRQIP